MTFKPSGKFPLKPPHHVWVSLEARKLRTFNGLPKFRTGSGSIQHRRSTFNVQPSHQMTFVMMWLL